MGDGGNDWSAGWPRTPNTMILEAGAVTRRSLARRFRVVHGDTGGLSRLTASSSSVAATVAPSARIEPATAWVGDPDDDPRDTQDCRYGRGLAVAESLAWRMMTGVPLAHAQERPRKEPLV